MVLGVPILKHFSIGKYWSAKQLFLGLTVVPNFDYRDTITRICFRNMNSDEENLEAVYDQMFSYRYTDKDPDYVETVSKPHPPGPCVANYFNRPKRNYDQNRYMLFTALGHSAILGSLKAHSGYSWPWTAILLGAKKSKLVQCCISRDFPRAILGRVIGPCFSQIETEIP